MSKRTQLLHKLKHVYSHNAKLVLDVENKDIELIIEGLEKQIAKKVINRYERYDLYGEWDGNFGTCPNCKEEWLEELDLNYCPNCGQKMDWGVEERNEEE